MPLRIGFDLDGTLADFASAFHDVELRLFGASDIPAGEPEREKEEDEGSQRRRAFVWSAIRSTPDFWTGLRPLDAGAVARINALALRHKWEVFFITQRPYTVGETVQRQTQRWLIAQGYDMPSVLVIGGSRGAAADALRLDYHVDDSARNCLDVKAESRARPILLVPDGLRQTLRQARWMKIGTAATIADALDILESATGACAQPKVLERIASLVGWGNGSTAMHTDNLEHLDGATPLRSSPVKPDGSQV